MRLHQELEALADDLVSMGWRRTVPRHWTPEERAAYWERMLHTPLLLDEEGLAAMEGDAQDTITSYHPDPGTGEPALVIRRFVGTCTGGGVAPDARWTRTVRGDGPGDEGGSG
jgi:hypothetical protein